MTLGREKAHCRREGQVWVDTADLCGGIRQGCERAEAARPESEHQRGKQRRSHRASLGGSKGARRRSARQILTGWRQRMRQIV